jgi:RNA polymerase sigma-70 factor (ECF subfamily)
MDHPRNSDWCERALRDAILTGDAVVWRSWYAANFDRLANYARWRCGGLTQVAEEVIQETWLTAVRRLATFDPEKAPFFAWLCGIAANAARNRIRASLRERRRFRQLQADDDHAARESSPEREKAERVAAALAALPEHYEAVLRAKYLEQKSVADIAGERNDPLKAVESLLTRARQAFRDAYEASHD